MRYLLIGLLVLLNACALFSKKELPDTVQYQNLIGQWKVVQSNFIPFDHISFCENLELNTIYDFDKYGVLKVYRNEKTNEHCNKEKKYRITGNALSIFEHDVVWGDKILELTPNTLKIKIDQIPRFVLDDLSGSDSSTFMDDSRVKFITKNGILVTMKKINNSDQQWPTSAMVP